MPQPIPNSDESEYHVARNFAHLAKIARSVSRMARTYGRLKKSKEWGISPEFVQLDPSLNTWLTELPADLALSFPSDGSPPWLPSAFVGNLHSYYYLSIILFNRPQLAVLSPTSPGGEWKHHMVVSYNAAKMLCRLQEAVMGSFGLNGLLCMQRGINFTIYAVLGCIVLHLVRLLAALMRVRWLTISLGRDNIAGSRLELGGQGLLHAPHEDAGKVHEFVAHGQHAKADRLGPRGLFGGYQETVCPEALLSIRQSASGNAPEPLRPTAGHTNGALTC